MSKEPTPQFPLYAQDFLTGCIYMTNDEIGMYIKMLCKQWTDEKIPKKRLGFLIGVEWDNVSDELKSKFVDMGEYLINTRLEEEREKRNNFKAKQSINGKKGGRGNKKNYNDKPKSKPNQSQKKPLDNDNDKDNDNDNDKGNDIEIYPTFEDFWNLYDKKVGKKEKVQEKWDKLNYKTKMAIMGYIPNYKISQPDKQFRKNPETFLNNEGWHDELIKQSPNGKQKEQRTTQEIARDAFNSETAKQFRFR